jgi:hypothetical protein
MPFWSNRSSPGPSTALWSPSPAARATVENRATPHPFWFFTRETEGVEGAFATHDPISFQTLLKIDR